MCIREDDVSRARMVVPPFLAFMLCPFDYRVGRLRAFSIVAYLVSALLHVH